MRPSFGFIPRFIAPLSLSTRQSPRPSPALTAVNAATSKTFTLDNAMLNNRMSTSSTSQSPFSSNPSSSSTNGAVEAEPTAEQTFPEGVSHRGHHPTASTSTAPENTTSNAPADNDSISAKVSSPPPSSTHGQTLALPPLPEALPPSPPPSSSSGGNSAGGGGGGGGNSKRAATTTLDLGGQSGGAASTRLDHLGPLVVHQDGTMSRISNWGEMTEIERQNTLRILGKRNQIRLASLRDGTDGEGKQE